VPTWADRLVAAGHEVPAVVPPVAAYVPAKRAGDLVFVAGQLPFVAGKLMATGKVPSEVSIELAASCAARAALNGLGAVASVVEPDRIEGIVNMTGFVAAPDSFLDHPVILNAASEIFALAFGDAGAHARTAVGVTALPLDSPVELQIVASVRGDR